MRTEAVAVGPKQGRPDTNDRTKESSGGKRNRRKKSERMRSSKALSRPAESEEKIEHAGARREMTGQDGKTHMSRGDRWKRIRNTARKKGGQQQRTSKRVGESHEGKTAPQRNHKTEATGWRNEGGTGGTLGRRTGAKGWKGPEAYEGGSSAPTRTQGIAGGRGKALSCSEREKR